MADEHFQGELESIDPRRLLRQENDEIDNFFIVLGLVYNDLKGLMLFLWTFKEVYVQPSPNEISVHAGNYSGIDFHMHRLFVGHMHEFFKFMEEKEDVFSTYEFKENILKRVPVGPRKRWLEIQEIALGKTSSQQASNFARALLKIRHNISYHYYQADNRLRAGFIKKFFKKSSAPGSEFAYYSLGQDMRTTRFYYVDAAVQEYLMSEASGGDGQSDRDEVTIFNEHLANTREMIESMNTCLYHLLRAYIKTRPHRG